MADIATRAATNGHGSTAYRIENIEKADAGLMRQLGSTGLLAFGGYVHEEFLPALQWPLASRVYREMADNDPIVGAMLTTHDLLARQVSHHVEPADESPLALEIATFVEGCLHDMDDTWPDTVSSIMSMLGQGFSLHEECYKVRAGMEVPTIPARDQDGHEVQIPGATSKFKDGKLGWRNLPIRAQESIYRWQFTRDNSHYLLGAYQRTTIDPAVTLPMGKLLHFRTTALKANPMGRSILRSAWRPWYLKRRVEELEGIGIERDLAGLPVAWLPPYVLDPEAPANIRALYDAMKDAVKNTRRNEADGLLMPLEYDEHGNKKFDFTLLSAPSRRQFDTDKVITRHDQRILTTALADFILLGHEGVGTLGITFGTTKVDLFAAGLDATLNQIDAEFTDVAIPRLVRYNGWPVELSPKLKHGEVQSIDLGAIALLILNMANAGFAISGDPVLQDHVLDTAGLPHTPAEEMLDAVAVMEAEVERRVASRLALAEGMNDPDESNSGEGGPGADETDPAEAAAS